MAASLEQAKQLIDQEQWGDAVTLLKQQVESDPRDWDAWYFLGLALHRQGDLEEAEHAHTRGAESRQHRMQALYNMAATKSCQNQPERAMEWLALARDAGFGDIEQIKNDPDLQHARSHPKFDDLVRTMQSEGEVDATGHQPKGP